MLETLIVIIAVVGSVVSLTVLLIVVKKEPSAAKAKDEVKPAPKSSLIQVEAGYLLDMMLTASMDVAFNFYDDADYMRAKISHEEITRALANAHPRSIVYVVK